MALAIFISEFKLLHANDKKLDRKSYMASIQYCHFYRNAW